MSFIIFKIVCLKTRLEAFKVLNWNLRQNLWIYKLLRRFKIGVSGFGSDYNRRCTVGYGADSQQNRRCWLLGSHYCFLCIFEKWRFIYISTNRHCKAIAGIQNRLCVLQRESCVSVQPTPVNLRKIRITSRRRNKSQNPFSSEIWAPKQKKTRIQNLALPSLLGTVC